MHNLSTALKLSVKATDYALVIGTEIVPAVLKPSKRKLKIDGVLKYHEKFKMEPVTLLLVRGFPTEKITEFCTKAEQVFSPEDRALLVESGGLLPFTL